MGQYAHSERKVPIQGATLDAANYGGGTGSPQVFASKGGVTGGGPDDERRFLQFAGKLTF